jgi:hypothetical protein
MKKRSSFYGKGLWAWALTGFLLAAGQIQAQQDNQGAGNQQGNDNAQITEEDAIRANFGMKRSGESIQFQILNDFENSEDWRAKATSPLGETRVRKVEGKPDNKTYEKELKVLESYKARSIKRRQQAAKRFAKQFDRQQPQTPADQKNISQLADIPTDHVLGVKTYFQDRGFDRVEVSPPNEYVIKGRAKEIRVWVLGRKFRHNLYVKLRDYKGKIHKLKMGRLDFFGWRRMKVTIPGWLPQSSRYALLDKNLHFVSFFVTSDRFETPGTFYFYLDNFSIITDTADNQYDGSEILDTW